MAVMLADSMALALIYKELLNLLLTEEMSVFTLYQGFIETQFKSDGVDKHLLNFVSVY